MNLTKHDALRKILAHPQHISILKKIKKDARQTIKEADLRLLTKDNDCQCIADSLNVAYKRLTTEQKKAAFPYKNEESVLISTETVYSWAHNTGNISKSKQHLVLVFLDEFNWTEEKIDVTKAKKTEKNIPTHPAHEERSRTEDHAIDVNDSDMRHWVNKKFWGYNRMTAAETTVTRDNKTFGNIENSVIQSFLIFEKFNPKTKRISVRRVTAWQEYFGHAYLRKGVIYLALDLQKDLSAERSSYIARIDSVHHLTEIRMLRICLDFEHNEPIATRSMLIPAEEGEEYDTHKISDRFVRLDEVDIRHRERVNDYLGDASNVILRTTPPTKNDLKARANNLITHIDKRWNHVLDDFFKAHIDFIKTGIASNSVEFEIVGMSMLDELFSKVVYRMPDNAVLCATSFASSRYFWKPNTINRLHNATLDFVQRGGTMIRFFFVNNLDKDTLTSDQMQVLTKHYEVYGNVENNESGVFLVNQLKISAPNRKLILTEKTKGMISWELSVERKHDDITGKATDIRITTSKDIHRNYAEKFDFFMDCMKHNNQIVRRVTADDIAFWAEKLGE